MTDDVVICDRCKLPHRAPFIIKAFDDNHQPIIKNYCEHCIEYLQRL